MVNKDYEHIRERVIGQIRFKDLSWPLKATLVYFWINLAFTVLLVLIGAISMIAGGQV